MLTYMSYVTKMVPCASVVNGQRDRVSFLSWKRCVTVQRDRVSFLSWKRCITVLLCVACSCFPFKLGPKHSPKLSYLNLTEEDLSDWKLHT